MINNNNRKKPPTAKDERKISELLAFVNYFLSLQHLIQICDEQRLFTAKMGRATC